MSLNLVNCPGVSLVSCLLLNCLSLGALIVLAMNCFVQSIIRWSRQDSTCLFDY